MRRDLFYNKTVVYFLCFFAFFFLVSFFMFFVLFLFCCFLVFFFFLQFLIVLWILKDTCIYNIYAIYAQIAFGICSNTANIMISVFLKSVLADHIFDCMRHPANCITPCTTLWTRKWERQIDFLLYVQL